MRKVDWNNPPKILRIVKNIETGIVKDIIDEFSEFSTSLLEMDPSIRKTFAEGSTWVSIMPDKTHGPLVEYRKKLEGDCSQFIDGAPLRYLTYEMIKHRPSSEFP